MRYATDLVIPVKPLAQAKTRLHLGDTAEHATLALAFALDTVAAAGATPGVRRVVVITSDERVRAAMLAQGVEVLGEGPPRGLNAALRHGFQALRERDATAAIGALQADLPALRPAELGAALELAAGTRAFCADRQGTGTTLLLGAAAAQLLPGFGPGSAAAHADSGAWPIDAELPGLRCDVDTTADLAAAAALGLGGHSTAALGLVRAAQR